MGHITDAEELMGKALRDVRAQKLRRVLWALGTAAVTVITTTITVTRTVDHYLYTAERQADEMQQMLRRIDKKLEEVEALAEQAKGLATEAKVTSDKALLYAQLTRGGAKP